MGVEWTPSRLCPSDFEVRDVETGEPTKGAPTMKGARGEGAERRGQGPGCRGRPGGMRGVREAADGLACLPGPFPNWPRARVTDEPAA